MSVRGLIQYLLFPDCACWLCRRDSILGADHLCDTCRAQLIHCPEAPALPPLDGLVAGLAYQDGVRNAVHAFKYHGRIHLAMFFAHNITIPDAWQCDCLVPVPLHPLKLWLRGYNQSEELCLALSQRTALPLRKDLLKRMRFTPSQTKLSQTARQANVQDAFAAMPDVKGLSVLLVDDVSTTQATLCACAKVLKKAGAKHIYAACACLAPAKRA